MRYAVLIGPLAITLLLLAACRGAAATLTIPRARPALPLDVRYLDREFSPILGPVRGDLLAVGRLEPTGLVLNDKVVEQGSDGNLVFAVPGVPLDEGFMVVYHGSDWPVYIPASAYPTCQLGAGAYVYTAVGASPPPPPLGPVTPSAPYPGGPTPTPVPTPSSGPFPTALSADGLLASGWPRMNLERVQLKYLGVNYRSTGGGYINDWGADTSIAHDLLEELEILNITYRVDVDLPTPLASLVIGDPVTDRVRVYRLKDRPRNEVIVVDQCPSDFQGDQFLFYKAGEPK